MDIVTLALAKKYANNRIKDLGTIQRLAGRVDTYEDLLAIRNPKAGDVYVVGTSDTENSEYMYIGSTWERLGPMVDLTNLVTIDDLVYRLGLYATISYVDNLVESASMAGEDLHSALSNKTLRNDSIVTCTKDYLDYKTGHTYLIKEKVRGPVSITDQLKALGFTVNISSTLESNNNKYYYIAKTVEGDIYAAYSQVPLNTSNSKFPSSGWRTFSVQKKNTSDPKFYYNNGSDTAPVLRYAITGSESSSTSKWWSIQFSTAVEATYSNDPAATAFTYYNSGEDELILTATDITPIQEIDTSNLVTFNDLTNRLNSYTTKVYVDDRIDTLDSQTDDKLSNYYTKAEVDAMINDIIGRLQYAPTSQDMSNLSIILGEDASTVEYTSTNSSVNYKLDNIIGGNK